MLRGLTESPIRKFLTVAWKIDGVLAWTFRVTHNDVEDVIDKDSDRSDRQRANSKSCEALHEMYSPSNGWSPAARLLSGPGRGCDGAQQGRL
jgi:hypothetical protein